MKVTQQQIEKAASIIRNGGLVAFPTETVYGLGANAFNAEAVARIFIQKERPSFDPLIVHISKIDDLEQVCKYSDDKIPLIAKHFWPGPLTIVLPKSKHVHDIVTSGLPTVAIRMPDNAIALRLIELAQCPIAAPSANKFGRLSPTTAQHVKKQLPDIDYILDGGKTTVGIESTVISLHPDGFEILRHGIITGNDLEKFIPQSNREKSQNGDLASPGMLKSHYSPNKPIYIEGEITVSGINKKRVGYLSFSGKVDKTYKVVEFLTKNSDLKEAALNLFTALHSLEENTLVDVIIAESLPETGIGVAIMDRLRKAAYKYSAQGDY